MAISASCLFFLANIVTLEGEVGGIDSDFLIALRLEESDISNAAYGQVGNEASYSVTLFNAQVYKYPKQNGATKTLYDHGFYVGALFIHCCMYWLL